MATIDLLTYEGAHHTVVALGGALDVTGLEFIDCAALAPLQRWQARARAWAASADLLLAAPDGVVLRLATPYRGATTCPPVAAAFCAGARQSIRRG
jgi:hypothetical protein